MVREKCPCNHCDLRCIGCHSTCERYIAWDKMRKQYLEARKKERRAVYDVVNFSIECNKRGRDKSLKKLGFY